MKKQANARRSTRETIRHNSQQNLIKAQASHCQKKNFAIDDGPREVVPSA